MKKTFLILGLICLLSFPSCLSKRGRNLEVNLSKVKTEPIKIKRFEKALFKINPDNLENELKRLAGDFPFFLSANLDDTLNLIQMYDFITDSSVKQVYRDCISHYPDLSSLENDFTQVFRYYRYYFPKSTIPSVYTYVSNFTDLEFPVKYADSTLIIALDMYLGSDYKAYRELGLPIYKIRRMNKENIINDCFRELANSQMIPPDESKTLLDEMIREGKILYFLDAMCPKSPDEIKIGYTQAQLKWCYGNESNIWSFMIENKLLYSSFNQAISKFITDGPFTADFSKESPAKIGSWIGWQIVRSYMNHNRKVMLPDLLSDLDAQKILTESKYRPENR